MIVKLFPAKKVPAGFRDHPTILLSAATYSSPKTTASKTGSSGLRWDCSAARTARPQGSPCPAWPRWEVLRHSCVAQAACLGAALCAVAMPGSLSEPHPMAQRTMKNTTDDPIASDAWHGRSRPHTTEATEVRLLRTLTPLSKLSDLSHSHHTRTLTHSVPSPCARRAGT